MNPNNCSLKDFIRFLESHGCKMTRHHKGHKMFVNAKATRPITIQDHVDPVPNMVIQSNLRTLGLTMKELRDFE
jgi:hypothetical protein